MRPLYVVFFLCVIYFYFGGDDSNDEAPVTAAIQEATNVQPSPAATAAPISRSPEYTRADAGNQIRGSGTVVRVLSDDNAGSRHQRFILRLASGQTLLVAHNIDLAPRVASIAVNDRVEYYGEYEWNSQGGVVHWTHHDPNGSHTNGWLRSEGRTYQ